MNSSSHRNGGEYLYQPQVNSLVLQQENLMLKQEINKLHQTIRDLSFAKINTKAMNGPFIESNSEQPLRDENELDTIENARSIMSELSINILESPSQLT